MFLVYSEIVKILKLWLYISYLPSFDWKGANYEGIFLPSIEKVQIMRVIPPPQVEKVARSLSFIHPSNQTLQWLS